MALYRIVIDDETRAIVDAIQAKTKSTSPSSAIALMMSRYGRHLLETWELSAAIPEHVQPVAIAPPPPAADNDFRFTEPIEF